MSDHPESNRILKEFVSQSPLIQLVNETCKQASGRLFVGGGAVRDLLLGGKVEGDIDLYIEGDEAVKAKVLSQLAQNHQRLLAESPSRLDFHQARNVPLFVRQFDFTIHTIVYDVALEKFFSGATAFEDLAAKRLRYTSLPFFATSLRSFVRVFRLAQPRNLTIDAAVLDAIRQHGAMLGTATPFMRASVVGELLHFFSLSSLRSVWKQVECSRILHHLFPFLFALEQFKTASNQTLLDVNLASIISVEETVAMLPASTRAKLALLNSEAYGNDKQSYIAKANLLAVLRLSLLFSGLGEAWVAIDPKPEQPFFGEAFSLNAGAKMLQIQKELAAAHPFVTKHLAYAADISIAAEKLVILLQRNEIEAFKAQLQALEANDQRLLMVLNLRSQLKAGRFCKKQITSQEIEAILLSVA